VDRPAHRSVTALHMSVLGGKAEVAALLLEARAGANQRGGQGEPTPLHAAAYTGNVEIACLLCAHGADRALTFAAPAGHGHSITPAQVGIDPL
jgi:ankyrin repeat protein